MIRATLLLLWITVSFADKTTGCVCTAVPYDVDDEAGLEWSRLDHIESINGNDCSLTNPDPFAKGFSGFKCVDFNLDIPHDAIVTDVTVAVIRGWQHVSPSSTDVPSRIVLHIGCPPNLMPMQAEWPQGASQAQLFHLGNFISAAELRSATFGVFVPSGSLGGFLELTIDGFNVSITYEQQVATVSPSSSPGMRYHVLAVVACAGALAGGGTFGWLVLQCREMSDEDPSQHGLRDNRIDSISSLEPSTVDSAVFGTASMQIPAALRLDDDDLGEPVWVPDEDMDDRGYTSSGSTL